jgi:hypothetical protein
MTIDDPPPSDEPHRSDWELVKGLRYKLIALT